LAFAYLDKIYDHLNGDDTLKTLCDSNIYQHQPPETAQDDLKIGNQSYISVEVKDWGSDPIYRIKVVCRKSPQHALSIADRVKTLIEDGTLETGENKIYVSASVGSLLRNKFAHADEIQVDVKTSITPLATIVSFTASKTSPQPYGEEIAFTCIASASEGRLLYKFLLKGPGTGNVWQEVTSWNPRNSWTWRSSKDDIGTNYVKVQIRDGKHAGEGSCDAESQLTYSLSSNTAPTISVFFAVPPTIDMDEETALICEASDPDNDEILYKFWIRDEDLIWRTLSGWQKSNVLVLNASKLVGISADTFSIKAQVRDGKHADEGSYDDQATSSLTISYNYEPSISFFEAYEGLEYGTIKDNILVCEASDPDGDEILYKFWLYDEAGIWRALSNWQKTNILPIPLKSGKLAGISDGEPIIYKAQIRDGKHAGEGSYDDQATFELEPSTDNVPTITSLTPNKSSPQEFEEIINFVCEASDPDKDGPYYKFWLYGPGTGNKWSAATGWQTANSWSWNPSRDDVGTNYIKVQIRDSRHSEEGYYDDQNQLTYVINHSLQLSSLNPSLSSPQARETTIEFTAVTNQDFDTDNVMFRFWLKGPGTGNVWQDKSGWISKNNWKWRTTDCDAGVNYVKSQIKIAGTLWDGSSSREKQVTYTIS